jgi:recombination protein RecR
MLYSPLTEQLIEAMRCLPGVGPKTAQRMTFYLLQRDRAAGIKLAQVMQEAMENIQFCLQCQNLSETVTCRICDNPRRDQSLLCITESPTDVVAVEQTASYNGLYFVLRGALSPIDGIGPETIGIDKLQQRISNQDIKELILATNPTVEGEATAHYISQMAKKKNIKTTRIAFGVPVGGELEFIDGNTLTHALLRREEY